MIFKAGIIGTGIGLKHLEAIHNFRGNKVKTIVEINKKKISKLRKKFPNLKISDNTKKSKEETSLPFDKSSFITRSSPNTFSIAVVLFIFYVYI